MGVTFHDECYIVEFDLELPVLSVFEPDYRCSDPIDDDEEYWWEKEEEILPWYEMEDETEVDPYTWEDFDEQELLEELSKYNNACPAGEESESDWTEEEVEEISTDDMLSGIVIEDESFTDHSEIMDSNLAFGEEGGSIADDDKSDVPVVRRKLEEAEPEAGKTAAPVVQEEDQTSKEDLLDVDEEEGPSKDSQKMEKTKRDEFLQQQQEEPEPPKAERNRRISKSMEELPTHSQRESKKSFPRRSITTNSLRQRRGSSISRSSSSNSRASMRRRSKSRERRNSRKYEWIKPEWTTKRSALKVTDNGSKVVGKLEAPTTFPKQREDRGVNEVANQGLLKRTQKGRLVRKGGCLAKPVTHINRAMNDLMDKKLMWSKPDWAKKKALLKKTDKGAEVKQGKSLNRKISAETIKDDETLAWKKPEWATRKVTKSTTKGEALKQRGSIYQKPEISKIGWEKPDWAKTDQVRSSSADLDQLKQRESLLYQKQKTTKIEWEKPGWAKTDQTRSSSADFDQLKRREKLKPETTKIEWEKPDWARTMTDQFRKPEGDIGQLNVGKEYKWEKPDWTKARALRETSVGKKMKEAGQLGRPISPKGQPKKRFGAAT